MKKSYANKTNFNLNSIPKFFYSKIYISIFFCNSNYTFYLTILLVNFSYFNFFDSSFISGNRSVSFSSHSSNSITYTNISNLNNSASSSILTNFINFSLFINSTTPIKLSTFINSAIFNFSLRYQINFRFKS